jgi:hypothetical protein
MKGQSRSSIYRKIKKAVDFQMQGCMPSTEPEVRPSLEWTSAVQSTSAVLPAQVEDPAPTDFSNIACDSELSDPESEPFLVHEENLNEVISEEPTSLCPSVKPFEITEFLRNWSLSNNITLAATSQLLKGLKNVHPELPLDARTLLRTPRHVVIEKMGSGEFAYFGLTDALLKHATSFNPEQPNLELNFNVDGIPLFDNSRIEFWPILCSIQHFDEIPPFPVAIFCGTGKPPLNEFFKMFILEMKCLQENGLIHNNIRYNVTVRAFIADAPAKAHIRCVKLYSGYNSCDRCTTRGTYTHHRMTFPEVTADLRTDESFASQTDEQFHVGLSPLLALDIGLISTFPLDYMHLVCLGVTKRIVQFWLRGMKGVTLKRARLSVAYRTAVSAFLLDTKHFWPSDFSRDPRGFVDIDRWKATELRQFLLYLSLPALKGLLEDDVYQHFLLFHCGITILAGKSYIEQNALAHELLTKFVTSASKFYGEGFVVYNVHALCHLSSDALRLGQLDTFGAFKFENKLGMLKKEIRSKSKPLQQLCKRVAEKENCIHEKQKTERPTRFTLLNEHEAGPTAGVQGVQYTKLIGPNLFISTNSRDRTVILHDRRVMVIRNFVSSKDGIFLIGSVYGKYSDFYTSPIKSSLLSVYFAEKLSNIMIVENISSVVTKAVRLPYKNGWVVFPLLHNPGPSR